MAHGSKATSPARPLATASTPDSQPPHSMPNTTCDLFISYRRSDAAGHARALYRDLCRRFEKQRIFFDRESIEAGTVFPERLRDGVDGCRVVLALIGPGWLEAKDASGQRRLNDANDFVRQEIAQALHLGRKLIPVLFDDTPMPAAADLPIPLQGLAACDALMLRGKNFEYELQLEELLRLLAAIPGMPAPLPPAEGVLIGSGLDFDVFRGRRYLPIRLRASLRAVFKPLIDDRTRFFGGRHAFFETIMQFAADEQGGYLAITAPPGFGKTALIANLVDATPEAFAYHFFAPVYGDETLDEKFFLQNVVQQMAAWHGYSAELPEAINELRALYQEFVDTPLQHQQVLLLDGLDEVTQWPLAPYLSRRLPAHLHIIVSVRDVGQDWRNEYGLPADQLAELPLGGLDRDEIQALFSTLGEAGERIAADPAALTHISGQAAYANDPALGADPFYVRFLAEDLASGLLTPAQIAEQPQGLDAYLDRWWKQIVQLAGDAPLRDLFGTLAAALGPIGRGDLEAINTSLRDDWAGDFFEQVLARVRRLVRQDESGRYGLAHPRLRHYVADPRRIGKIDDYRSRLRDYCLRWPEHRSPYALSFLATHLADAGRSDELCALFSGRWMAAQWSVLGTYSPLIADLDRAARALLALPEPDYPRLLALVVARQTGRELMLSFPDELYEAWTAQGEIERALAGLGALGKARGRAIDPLLAVATRLLDTPAAAADGNPRRAATLLLQVIDQLPLVRLANEQQQALAKLAALLPLERGLPDAQRTALIRQAIDFAETADDAVQRAAGIGAIASALRASPPDRELARGLLTRARQALPAIDLAADRAFVLASLLPALENFAPDEVLAEMTTLAEQGAALLEHGSLAKNPLIRLLRAWQPWQLPQSAPRAQRQESIALLQCFAEFYLDDSSEQRDYAGAALSAIVPALCRLEDKGLALQLIERCWHNDAVEGALCVSYAVDALREFLPERLSDWLTAAKELTDASHHDMPINQQLFTASISNALAACGDWQGALKLAATLRGSERADALIDLARRTGVAFDNDQPAREAMLEKIRVIAQDPELTTGVDDLARLGVVTAQALGAASGKRTDAALARAASLCLAEMPEGDADQLRHLLAMALHEDGADVEALATLHQMSWVSSLASSMVVLIESVAAEAGQRDACTQALMAELQAREGASLYGDALRMVAPLVVSLAREGAPAAGPLGQFLADRIGSLPIEEQIDILANLSAALCHTDADQAAKQYERLLDWFGALRAHGYEIRANTLARVIGQLAAAADLLGDHLPPLAEKLRELAGRYADPQDAITLGGALCLLEVSRGCQALGAALGRLLPAVAALANKAPPALYISRMFADIVGRQVGSNEPQAKAATALAEAVVRCARPCPDEAARVMEACLEQALAIDNKGDRAQALIDICGKLAAGPRGWPQRLEASLAAALTKTQLADPEGLPAVLAAAVDAMCAADDPDTAERLARQATDPALLETLLANIATERERLTLGELSLFERAFVGIGDGQLASAVLHSVKVENDGANILKFLAETLVTEQWGSERGRLLCEFLPQFAAPLRALHGSSEIGRLVAEVERLDRAFLEAAGIVGEGGG
ncbi:toll/interleukin-1 receptor domain-containing protein [Accumulibacter sp.]|nr:toll/interleukin-1 receptor domain-containing protein [Accumulibacter sp.]HRF03614.1 toll/interleukin-1 receptor domain-containing protein [Accumulibacter sp.]